MKSVNKVKDWNAFQLSSCFQLSNRANFGTCSSYGLISLIVHLMSFCYVDYDLHFWIIDVLATELQPAYHHLFFCQMQAVA